MCVLTDLARQLIHDLQHTGWIESIAVIAGILSVWYSRSENILVYPTRLVNTFAHVFLRFLSSLHGEPSLILYYTVLNPYGWYAWTRKARSRQPVLHIRWS